MFKRIGLAGAVLALAGCSATVPTVYQVGLPSSGRSFDYVLGRSDNKGGNELVYRDVYDWRGELIDSKAHGGPTMLYGVTQGAVAAALIAGGNVGASALRRPDRTNVSTNVAGTSSANGTATSSNSNTNSNSNANANSNSNSNTNTVNVEATNGGGDGGSSGGDHTNHSGGGDGSNPGGHGNDDGADNPGGGGH